MHRSVLLCCLYIVQESRSKSPNDSRVSKPRFGSLEDGDIDEPGDFDELSVGRRDVERMSMNKKILSGVPSLKRKVGFILRELKAAHSSDFEGSMLKCTRPDCFEAKEKYVRRLVESVSTFPAAMKIPSSPDYYLMFLRKVHTRLMEADWRTKVKAAYVIHRISISGDSETQNGLRSRLRSLRQMKHRSLNYFDLQEMVRVNAEDGELVAFLNAYVTFVFARLNLQYDPGRGAEEVTLHSLRNACTVFDRAFSISWVGNFWDNHEQLLSQCIYSLVRDLFVSVRPSTRSLLDRISEGALQLTSLQTSRGLETISKEEARQTRLLILWLLEASL